MVFQTTKSLLSSLLVCQEELSPFVFIVIVMSYSKQLLFAITENSSVYNSPFIPSSSSPSSLKKGIWFYCGWLGLAQGSDSYCRQCQGGSMDTTLKDINHKLSLSLLISHGPLRMRGSACWWFSQIKATQGHRRHASMSPNNWNVRAIRNHWRFHGKRVAMHLLSHRAKRVLTSGVMEYLQWHQNHNMVASLDSP